MDLKMMNEDEKKKLEEAKTGTGDNGGNKPKIVPTNPAASWTENKGQEESILGGSSKDFKDVIPNNENANLGIRNFMENQMGVDSKSLGYDGKNVTFDGKAFITPERNTDGTTYVENKQDIYDAVNEYAKQNGIVAVRDYTNSKGIPYDISWNGENGTVSINGVSFKPTYIIDGKAYLYQSELDRILGKASNGIRTDTDILNESKAKYGIDEAFKNYVNFDYDPNADRSYQAFMDIYNRAVEDEYKRNVAQAKFRTGGLASPAVMQMASAVRERALDDSAGYIQQFEDRARSLEKDKLSTIVSQMMNDYSLGSQANSTDLTNYYNNLNQRMADEKFWRELRDADVNWELALPYLSKMYANEGKLSDLGVEAQGIANRSGILANEGAEIANEANRKALGWSDAQNIIGLIDSLYGGKLNAFETGISYPLPNVNVSGLLNEDVLPYWQAVLSAFGG